MRRTLVETGPHWIKYYRNGRPLREKLRQREGRRRQAALEAEGKATLRRCPCDSKDGRILIDEPPGDVVNDYRMNGKKATE